MPPITRRQFLTATTTATAAAALAPNSTAAKAPNKPNILIIVADDLGYADLSCYGGPDIQTPHLDALAERGMRFAQFYANCPVCSPTRAALLTGRYPDLVGVPGVIRTHRDNSWGRLSDDAVLLPELLDRAGYHSACIGKWHLGLEKPNRPNDRGFDFFHGWLGDMMDDYYTHRRHDINYMRRNHKTIDPEGHATDLFTNWATDYLESRAKKDNPFFLYLAYNAPHTPIQPPEAWVQKVKKREPDMNDNRAKLVAFIEHMDHGIGQVLDTLEKTGQRDNTLVLFVSDNGGHGGKQANNGPWRGAKQDMYEGGIRVPMIAAWPDHIAPGTTSDTVGMTMDFYATAAEAAGAKIRHEIDAVSLLPILRGEAPLTPERTLFWVRREGGHHGGRAYYAARHGDYKLVQNSPFEPYQLYNLADDPKEQSPLERKHPQYKKLFRALRDHINEAGRIPWQRAE